MSDEDLPGPNPSVRGGFERAEEYYGREFDSISEITRVRQLEASCGSDVHEWIEEGLPVGAMGKPSKMEAYRERKGTPIPWDIEDQNQDSEDRNTADINRKVRQLPAGRTDVSYSVRDVISSPGQSLDEPIQREMEERMGESFDDVQIHAGPKAAETAEKLNARAFTVGNHIAFNHGEYDPESAEGQHVLAHELAHVRQQTGGALSMLPQEDVALEIDPDPELEREAEETAERVMAGGKLDIRRMQYTDIHVQRKWNSGPSVEERLYDDESEQSRDGFDVKEALKRFNPMEAEGQKTLAKGAVGGGLALGAGLLTGGLAPWGVGTAMAGPMLGDALAGGIPEESETPDEIVDRVGNALAQSDEFAQRLGAHPELAKQVAANLDGARFGTTTSTDSQGVVESREDN